MEGHTIKDIPCHCLRIKIKFLPTQDFSCCLPIVNDIKLFPKLLNILVQAAIRKYLMESDIFLSGKPDNGKFNVFK